MLRRVGDGTSVRRRDSGMLVLGLGVAVGSAITIALIGAAVLAPDGPRGRTEVDRPFVDLQLPTL